ncbi:hypothetical protein [Pelagicoccus sp. SDUM812003]|uniref:Dph6-related ATP pyrophosphatase n=1 Tax=Pelagicoccus sp. SDUM812003 TaxID=3041267 RepID=UPI0028106DFE|nr:hypothetical protein [Pelagicoccus sp. SDUM812003]MDQ8203134.1 adenine nucleotide alpha hydrolase [Pelagicoccus sp. SDUM812003]
MSGDPIAISWSSGKDSMLALARARELGYEVVSLVTVVRDDRRVSVHGVRRELLRRQADALGLPLREVLVNASNPYEKAVSAALADERSNGVAKVCYGDLFLGDIKKWRDELHRKIGLECIYPLWERDTQSLAEEFISSGRKAILTCVNTKQLDMGYAGRAYDSRLLSELPEGVDPCGENGEFHTFVHDGPEFRFPVSFEVSKPVIREFDDPGHRFTFGFCDLRPAVEAAKG